MIKKYKQLITNKNAYNLMKIIQFYILAIQYLKEY